MFNRKLERIKSLLERKTAIEEAILGDIKTRNKLTMNADNFGQDVENRSPIKNDPNLSKAILDPTARRSKAPKFKPYQPSTSNPISKSNSKSKKGTGSVTFVGEGDLYYEDEIVEEGFGNIVGKIVKAAKAAASKSKPIVGRTYDDALKARTAARDAADDAWVASRSAKPKNPAAMGPKPITGGSLGSLSKDPLYKEWAQLRSKSISIEAKLKAMSPSHPDYNSLKSTSDVLTKKANRLHDQLKIMRDSK